MMKLAKVLFDRDMKFINFIDYLKESIKNENKPISRDDFISAGKQFETRLTIKDLNAMFDSLCDKNSIHYSYKFFKEFVDPTVELERPNQQLKSKNEPDYKGLRVNVRPKKNKLSLSLPLPLLSTQTSSTASPASNRPLHNESRVPLIKRRQPYERKQFKHSNSSDKVTVEKIVPKNRFQTEPSVRAIKPRQYNHINNNEKRSQVTKLPKISNNKKEKSFQDDNDSIRSVSNSMISIDDNKYEKSTPVPHQQQRQQKQQQQKQQQSPKSKFKNLVVSKYNFY
jgi:hypothetical protein